MELRRILSHSFALAALAVAFVACGPSSDTLPQSIELPEAGDGPSTFSITGVTVTVTPKKLVQKSTDTGHVGEMEFDVTVTNNSGALIYYVDPEGGPLLDAVGPSELHLRWAVQALPDNVNIGIFRRPPLRALTNGNSITRTVRVSNPVQSTCWQGVWFDAGGLPVPAPTPVTLQGPFSVKAIVAVSATLHDATVDVGWGGFVAWQQLVESSPVNLDL